MFQLAQFLIKAASKQFASEVYSPIALPAIERSLSPISLFPAKYGCDQHLPPSGGRKLQTSSPRYKHKKNHVRSLMTVSLKVARSSPTGLPTSAFQGHVTIASKRNPYFSKSHHLVWGSVGPFFRRNRPTEKESWPFAFVKGEHRI